MSPAPELEKLYEAILTGDADAAIKITKEAVDANLNPQDLVTERMIPAMDEVGRRFEEGEFFVPELLISGRAILALAYHGLPSGHSCAAWSSRELWRSSAARRVEYL